MVATVFLAQAVVALGAALRYLMPDLDVGALRVRIDRRGGRAASGPPGS